MDSIRINFKPAVQGNVNKSGNNRIHFGSTLEKDTFVSSSPRQKESFVATILRAIGTIFGSKSKTETAPEIQNESENPQPAVLDSAEPAEFNFPFEPYEDPEEVLPENEMSKFLESPDYEEKIKKATQGKYQQQFIKMLSLENLDKEVKAELIKSDLTEEQFLGAIKQLSKSTFKAALNKPSQYINYTQDNMFNQFRIDSMLSGKSFNGMEDLSSAYMVDFFGRNIVKMARALQYIDTDALNQMMDKRSTSFSLKLRAIDEITPENGELLKKLLKQTKEGDARQKIKLCELVEIFQSNNFDMKLLENLLQTNPIDTSSLNDVFKEALIKKAGLEKADEKTNTNFNPEFMHLLFSKHPLLNNGVTAPSSDFDNLFRETVKGTFDDYISDTNNEYGKANENTKKAFEKYNLNYDNWLNPDFKKSQFNLNGQNMSLKIWDRNPAEDIFLGNKTRCCTAIATGSNSAAMPIFLMNTSFNVIELCDKSGEVKGMARIYMSDVEGETALVIDSIELADVKQMNPEEKAVVAKNFFDYAADYAQTITGSPTNVYYIEADSKLELHGHMKQERKQNRFIGDVSTDRIYSNRNSGSKWDDIRSNIYTYFFKAA